MNTLKYEKVANVGEKIRAYEFDPNETGKPCYLEGVVLDKGFCDKPYKCYFVQVTKIIHFGEDKTEKFFNTMKNKFKVEPLKFVPFEMYDDYEKRVQKI
jgi:hypothetical protein